jgi:hypothetical protein
VPDAVALGRQPEQVGHLLVVRAAVVALAELGERAADVGPLQLGPAHLHAAAVVGVQAQHAAALGRLELEVPDVVDAGHVVAAELAHRDVRLADDHPAGPQDVRRGGDRQAGDAPR